MERSPATKFLLKLVTGLFLSLPPGALAHPPQEAKDVTSHQNAMDAFVATVKSLKEANVSSRQERHIANLSRPLMSRGSVHMDEEGTLFWKQEHPFPVLIKMMPESVEEIVAGSPPQRFTRDQNPYLITFSRAFVSLFAGETQQLSSLFKLEPVQTDSGWRIQLTPKDENVKKMINTISIFGAQRIEKFQFMESGTNRTTIYLSY